VQDCANDCWDKNQQLNSSIDDLAVYNRALSETEMLSLYDMLIMPRTLFGA